MLMSFMRQEATVIRPSWTDDRGTLVPDWDTPDSTQVVAGCSVQPGASVESLDGRQGVTIRWSVYMPPGVEVSAHDGVRFEGKRYHIDGEPRSWQSPTGRLSHTEVLLIDWQG